MKRSDLEQMSVDELWALHLEISEILEARIAAEKSVLEERLTLLSRQSEKPQHKRQRRPYPPVFPKFRNPDDPTQTWAGRGKRPRWVLQQLKSGKRLQELIIRSVGE